MSAPGLCTSGTSMDPSQLASLLRIQNMIKLCKQLRLPVTYKVSRVHRQPQTSQQQQATLEPSRMDAEPTAHCQRQMDSTWQQAKEHQQKESNAHLDHQQDAQQGSIELAVVVHVMSDFAFKKYLQHCSASDLMLLRGMLLKVEVDATHQHLLDAHVQQAFLPKFENEGQDSSIADAIVEQADQMPMVITIKHSGSLVTLSHQGFAAKNSLDNEFTVGAALLLQTHFQRLLGCKQGLQRLREFMDMLQEKRLAFSFEMVTGCHGHHGQIPAGECLVTTSAHTVDDSGQTSFLPWQNLLLICLEWGLPLNDTWIIHGSQAAAAARELLDHLALSGCTTSEVLDQLGKVSDQISDQPDKDDLGDLGSVAGFKVSDRPRSFCIHLPGTYPHDQWQGSRIEGFVVSQGQDLETREALQGLWQTRERVTGQVLSFDQFTLELQRPYQHLLQKSGDAVSPRSRVQSQCSSWLPDLTYEPIDSRAPTQHRQTVVDLLEAYPVPLNTRAALQLPDGTKIFSRTAVESLSGQDLPELLKQGTTAAAAAAAAANGSRALPAEPNPLQAMQLLAGPGHQQTSLRYKKKILMWSDTEVGYCMMTFVIRNGLTALRLSEMSYLSALGAMAKHSWGLPQALVEKVVYFGRCWARWIARHGGVSSVKESSYLDAAEAFVQDFLAGVAGDGSDARPEGAFQGIVIAIDVSERVVKQLQRSMHLQHILQPKPNSGEAFFSKSLVREGTILRLPADKSLPKNQLGEFVKAAAPYAYLIVQPPNAIGDTPQAKKACGMHASKLRTLNTMISGSASLTHEQLEQRTYQLPQDFAENLPQGTASQGEITVHKKHVKESKKQTNKRGRQESPTEAAASSQLGVDVQQTEACTGFQQVSENNNMNASLSDRYDDVITDERLADVMKAVVDKFGSGSSPEQQDPAFITCFVALPGSGKTVLASRLKQLAINSSSSGKDSSRTTMSVEVLNSDIMKARQEQKNTGLKYWHQVAGAADSNRGGGHQRLVLADKNLVPAPRDNFARVTDIINKSGATTIAVILTCVLSHSQASNPTSSSHPEAAAPATDQQEAVAPELAFPLELVALCMLRVLQRQSHEGGLDASLADAMSVVVKFAFYFNNLSSSRLRQQQLACFQHVIELPVAAVRADKQIPAAVVDHIAQGLSEVQISSDPPLPPEWESRMRQLLSDPDNAAAIAAIASPLDNCAAQLQTSIAEIMHCSSSSRGDAMQGVAPTTTAAAPDLGRLDPRSGVSGDLRDLHLNLGQLIPVNHTAAATAEAAAVALGSSGGAAGVVRYVGVAVLHEERFRQQLQELVDQLQQQQQQQILPSRIKSDLHVTLWHVDSMPAAAGANAVSGAACAAAAAGAADVAAVAGAAGTAAVAGAAGAAGPSSSLTALMSVAGQEVQMQITALDCSPQLTAAQVQILSGPDAVTQAWGNLVYPHVTLSVAQGYNAVDSNQLPARVADANDGAFRVLLQEPLLVVGQVLPFE